jgi:aminoglycoside phosphotransferase (APT) family kinase protein
MSDAAKLTKTLEIELSVDEIAFAFCELDDDAQAQFFVNVARIMRTWKSQAGWDWQAWKIGRHLRTCSCVTDDAREVVRAIANGLDGIQENPQPLEIR